MTRSYYRVRVQDETVMHVRSTSYEAAAQTAGRRLYGRTVTVYRVTGTQGLSGFFSAYKYDRKVNAESQQGSPFHVLDIGR